jgi:hypothetical protein
LVQKYGALWFSAILFTLFIVFQTTFFMFANIMTSFPLQALLWALFSFLLLLACERLPDPICVLCPMCERLPKDIKINVRTLQFLLCGFFVFYVLRTVLWVSFFLCHYLCAMISYFASCLLLNMLFVNRSILSRHEKLYCWFVCMYVLNRTNDDTCDCACSCSWWWWWWLRWRWRRRW